MKTNKTHLALTLCLSLLVLVAQALEAKQVCYNMPSDNAGQLNNGGMDRSGAAKQLESNTKNPAMEVFGCAVGVTMAGMDPVNVFDDVCGCMDAIKEACKFKFDKKKGIWKVTGAAACPVFLPICLAGKC